MFPHLDGSDMLSSSLSSDWTIETCEISCSSFLLLQWYWEPEIFQKNPETRRPQSPHTYS